MEEKLLWEGSPSIFQYIGTYVASIILWIIGYKLLYMITPYPCYYLTHSPWTSDLTRYRADHWPQFALAAIYLLSIFLVLLCIYRICQSKLTRYMVLNDQVIVKKFTLMGFVHHHTEMYRVIDFEQLEPFTIIIFGLSHVVLHSTDKQFPMITLSAIRKGHEIIHFLRNETERVRGEKGVREFTTRWN